MSKYVISGTSALPEISLPSSKDTSNSFFNVLFNKPWKIILYVIVVILIINVIVFLIRRYTSLLDYPAFDKIFSVLPWLRK